jgi:hypothetical protein
MTAIGNTLYRPLSDAFDAFDGATATADYRP